MFDDGEAMRRDEGEDGRMVRRDEGGDGEDGETRGREDGKTG